mgnify:CR=1 FL=1
MRYNLALDSIDWAILRIIQEDASLSLQAISEAVGLSANPCWRRIKRMEESGIIERRVTLLNPHKVGAGTCVFVTIHTRRHDAQWLEAFREAIDGINEIMECHRMAGDIDYLLKLRVEDIAGYDRFYQRLIRRVPDIADVKASFSMEEIKATTALPRPS